MNIYRRIDDVGNKIVIAEIKGFEYNGTHMGERFVTASIKTPFTIDFAVGDFIIYTIDGVQEEFTLDKLPNVKKVSSAGSSGEAFQYDLKFYAFQYELTLVQMRDISLNDETIYTGMPNFSFYGDAKALCDCILANLNVAYNNHHKTVRGQWEFDLSESAKNSEAFELSFSGESCFDALTMLNDESTFGLEFVIRGRTIKVGYEPKIIRLKNGNPFYFKYGKSSHKPIEDGGGLYTIEKNTEENSIITRLRAYGGTQNVNKYYNGLSWNNYKYSPNVMLPDYAGTGRDHIEAPQDLIDYYGIREGSVVFDDIIPSIQGVRLKDFPKKIVTIEADHDISYSKEILCVKLFNYKWTNGNVNPVKEPVTAPDDIYITVHNQVDNVITIKLRKGTHKALMCDYKDESKHISKTDNPCIIHVNIGRKQTHSYNGVAYIPYCYNPNYTESELESEDRIDEIVGYSENNGMFNIYVRDLGFDLGRTFSDDGEEFIRSVWFLDGTSVTFSSGLLSGYTFELSSADSDTAIVKRIDSESTLFNLGARICITLKLLNSDQDVVLPNKTMHPKGGDRFVLSGLTMPMLYHYWAENKLLERATKYLEKQCGVIEKYVIEFDNVRLMQAQTIGMQLCEGNSIAITDKDLGTKKKATENLIIRNGVGTLGSVGFFSELNRFSTSHIDSLLRGRSMNDSDNKLNAGIELLVAYLEEGVYTFMARNVSSHSDLYMTLQNGSNSQKQEIAVINGDVNDYVQTIVVPPLSKVVKTFDAYYTHYVCMQMQYYKQKTVNGETVYYIDGGYGVELSSNWKLASEKTRIRYKAYLGDNLNRLDKKYCTLFTNCVNYVRENDGDGVRFAKNSIVKKRISVEFKFNISEKFLTVYDDTNNNPHAITPKVYVEYANSIGTVIIDWYDLTLDAVYDDTYRCVAVLNDCDVSKGVGVYLRVGDGGYESYYKEHSDSWSYVQVNITCNDSLSMEMEELAPLCLSQKTIPSFYMKDVILYKGDVDYDLMMNSADIKIEQCTINVECADALDGNFDKKTYSATLSNTQKVGQWSLTQKQIKDNNNAISNTKKDLESLVSNARDTQNRLETLQNSIFDPDGNMQNNFLSTMILQVGADSMNYYLEKTRITVQGEMNNITYDADNDVITFGRDILHHYEYKCNGDKGDWSIEQEGVFDLRRGGAKNNVAWSADASGKKVYFVAVACSKLDVRNAFWIVSDDQRILSVEGDVLPYHYIFNYAVIGERKNGRREIIETRGKSYMYGDNLYTGTISSMNNMSWINLVDGTFNFGDKLIMDADGNLINNGMVLSNRIMVKDDESSKVDKTVAGMNGILDQEERLASPAFWAGGTYDEATDKKTNMVIDHRGLGRVGVLRYEPEYVLAKSLSGLNTVVSAVDLETTKNELGGDVTFGDVFAPKEMPVIDNIGQITIGRAGKGDVSTPNIVMRRVVPNWNFDGSLYKVENTPINKIELVSESDVIELDYDAPKSDHSIFMLDPVKELYFGISGASIVVDCGKNNATPYSLSYVLKFELYLNNGYGNTRICTLKSEPYVLAKNSTSYGRKTFAVSGYKRLGKWTGFQFSDASGGSLLINEDKRVGLRVRTTIDISVLNVSFVGFLSGDPTITTTLKIDGVMRYKTRFMATILASDGIGIYSNNSDDKEEVFSVRDRADGQGCYEMKFEGKVRESTTSFREGKLRSLPNGVLYLRDGGEMPYNEGLALPKNVTMRMPIALRGAWETSYQKDPLINGEQYLGYWIKYDLTKMCAYRPMFVLSVEGRLSVEPRTVGDALFTNYWVQEGYVLWVRGNLVPNNGVITILIY